MLAGALAFLAAVRELFVLQVLSFVFIFAIYAQSWNLAAHSGQHSLGHATFLGLGSSRPLPLPPPLRLPPAVPLFLPPPPPAPPRPPLPPPAPPLPAASFGLVPFAC